MYLEQRAEEDTLFAKKYRNPAKNLHMPSGCAFRTRCRYATEKCAQDTRTVLSKHWKRLAIHRRL